MPRAGLTPTAVTEAAARLADEVGLAQLSMGLLAERLSVKPPSLYKHIDGHADLFYRIAVLAATELGDALRDAAQGRAATDALVAAAQAMRTYVNTYPGRYAAGNNVRPHGPDDDLTHARHRVLESFLAVLRGYDLNPTDEVHALRMLRSMLHGFANLEAEGSFRFDTNIDDSFTWMVTLIDHGLRSPLATSDPTAAR